MMPALNDDNLLTLYLSNETRSKNGADHLIRNLEMIINDKNKRIIIFLIFFDFELNDDINSDIFYKIIY